MNEMIADFPFWGAWIFMFILGTLRGQGTYWIGRGASSAATHVGSDTNTEGTWAKIKAWLNSDKTKTGRTLVHKIGVVAVPLSYLTVGLQTAVLAGAGLVRIQWWKFSLAQIPGAIAWATIYSGVGLAAWSGIIAVITGNGWLTALVLIVLAIIVVTAIWFVSKSVKRNSGAEQGSADRAQGEAAAAESRLDAGQAIQSKH